MATFRYIARTPDGNEVQGMVQANSRLEALDAVRKQGYWVLELFAQPEPTTPLVKVQKQVYQPLFGGIPLKAQALFFRQLATMLSAGVPIYQALDTLSKQRGHPRLRRALMQIKDAVVAGEGIVDAFDRHPALFSPIVRAMIRVGTTSGTLERMLRQIADYLENELELRRLLSRVTFYPKMVLFFAILIPGLIPALITILGGVGGKPVGEVMADLAWTYAKILLIVFGIWALFRLALQSQTLRLVWGMFTVSIPWIGFTVRQLALARFARALSALYGAGIPLSQAIRYASDACGNEYLRSRLVPTASHLEAGRGITESLAQSKVLPDMVMDMIATGENTGELGLMMDKVAEYYEEEGKLRSHQAGYVFGVLVFLGVAIYVAAIVISFYADYFQSLMGSADVP